MIKELIGLFRQFLKENREEILKQKLLRSWAKDENFEAASELFKIFTDSNSDAVMEIDVPGKFKVRYYRDIEGNLKQERLSDEEYFLGRRG